MEGNSHIWLTAYLTHHDLSKAIAMTTYSIQLHNNYSTSMVPHKIAEILLPVAFVEGHK